MRAMLPGRAVAGTRQRPQDSKVRNGNGNSSTTTTTTTTTATAANTTHGHGNASTRNRAATPIATPTKSRRPQEMEASALKAVPTTAVPSAAIYSTSPLTAEEVAFIMADMKETDAKNEAPIAGAASVIESAESLNTSSASTSTSTSASTTTSTSLSMSPTESPEKPFVSLQKGTDAEWSQVLPKEEEMLRVLKGRMAGLQAQLVAAEEAAKQSARAVEHEQQRIRVLEAQLRDEKKTTTTAKAQLVSLRTVNNELAGKLSQLDASLQGALDTQTRQLSQSLDQARVRIAELEASQRRSSMTSETAVEELKTLRAEAAQLRHELETEKAKHRAEHQNNVGAAIALHQEIAQLQGERESLRGAVQKAETRELRALETMQNAETQLHALAAEKTQLLTQLQEAQSRAQNAAVEASFAAPPGLELQMEEMREQLNAAEATIASLQSDLQREMKRAEVAKRVYETKLADLQGPK
jgi:DNA repair exonuclease SbcCD ATPase subunit